MTWFIDRRLNGKNKSAVNRQRFMKQKEDLYNRLSGIAGTASPTASSLGQAGAQTVDLVEVEKPQQAAVRVEEDGLRFGDGCHRHHHVSAGVVDDVE